MILLAPAKSLNEVYYKDSNVSKKNINKIKINNKTDINSKLSLELKNQDKVEYLINNISNLTKDEMGLVFKIKNETLDKTYEYYNNHTENQSLEAILLYNGISYKQLTLNSLKSINKLDYEYLKSNVYIISTLYGLINSVDKIKPYRLDFSHSKIIGKSLYEFWSDTLNTNILNLKPNSILNLASLEYSKIINKDIQSKITIYNVKSTEKISSVNLKKIRGQILDYCINNKVNDYTKLVGVKLPCVNIISLEGNNLIIEATN